MEKRPFTLDAILELERTMSVNVSCVPMELTANVQPAAAGASEWVKLAQVGEWKGSTPKQLITKDILRSCKLFFDTHYTANSVDLVFDYEHQSLFAKYSGEPAPAAGWGRQMDLRNDDSELWCLVTWNSTAAQLRSRGEYRYLSSVILWNLPDPVSGSRWSAAIDSVGLTNRPFMKSVQSRCAVRTETEPASANSSDGAGGDGSSVAQVGALGAPKEVLMELLLKLATALGMEPQAVADMLGCAVDAADDDVLKNIASKLTEGVSVNTAMASVAEALSLKRDAFHAVPARIAALKGGASGMLVVANAMGLPPDSTAEAVIAEIARLRSSIGEDQAERMVANAVTAGKITPANKAWWLSRAKEDLKGTEMTINSMPALLAAPSKGAEPPSSKPQLTAEEKSVCSQLGIPEDKFNPAP